jgi:hypothetical protein
MRPYGEPQKKNLFILKLFSSNIEIKNKMIKLG